MKNSINSRATDEGLNSNDKNSLPNNENVLKCGSDDDISSQSIETQTLTSLRVTTDRLTIVSPKVGYTVVNPSGSSENPLSLDGTTAPFQLEVIPKAEPLTDDECEAVPECENTAPAAQQPKPFLFLSEFLSKNTAFNHLINTLNEVIDKTDDNLDDKSIIDKTIGDKSIVEIDLNNDSNDELDDFGVQPDNDINPFDEEIIDLTPKEVMPKNAVSKKSKFLKKLFYFY